MLPGPVSSDLAAERLVCETVRILQDVVIGREVCNRLRGVVKRGCAPSTQQQMQVVHSGNTTDARGVFRGEWKKARARRRGEMAAYTQADGFGSFARTSVAQRCTALHFNTITHPCRSRSTTLKLNPLEF